LVTITDVVGRSIRSPGTHRGVRVECGAGLIVGRFRRGCVLVKSCLGVSCWR